MRTSMLPRARLTSTSLRLQTARLQSNGHALAASRPPTPAVITARRLQSGFHAPLQRATPIDPASLPKPRAVRHYPRTRKFARRVVQVAIALGLVYAVDSTVNASAITRSLRTFSLGLLVAIDYKINFRPEPYFYDSVDQLHTKNAERLSNLLRTNGGLYLKIGQAIAMQTAVLPPQFQKMFARMFDDAPQNPWKDVEQVIREDFGKSVEEVFGVTFDPEKAAREGLGVMERTARASASVAQVHWARLPDGREVAIKVQKREIAKQVGWDLWAFKVVARAYTWWFDLPVYGLVPYISERLMLETDFENEASNGEHMRDFVLNERRLRGRVYIPEVYRDLTSKRVMTAEWIEGVRLWDKQGIESSWKGGWKRGTPGCGGTPLDDIDVGRLARAQKDGLLKPARNHWKGRDGKGGLGLSYKDVMTTMVDLFSAQMFLFGWVHCDPHPGNIFVRRLPSGRAELVLIDHGLYIQMSPEFRREYATFWKSLLTFDNAAIRQIVTKWGFGSPELFASATLMRPYTGGDGSTGKAIRKMSEKERKEMAFEMQQKLKQGVRKILGDEDKWPRELIFIGRNMRIVQGNNQHLGSPVNRIRITGTWASRALAEQPNMTISQRVQWFGRHLIFQTVMLGSDVAFMFSKIRQWIGIGKGLEDDIEAQMRKMAEGMGVQLNHDVFEG